MIIKTRRRRDRKRNETERERERERGEGMDAHSQKARAPDNQTQWAVHPGRGQWPWHEPRKSQMGWLYAKEVQNIPTASPEGTGQKSCHNTLSGALELHVQYWSL